jgi:hypothetical protein
MNTNDNRRRARHKKKAAAGTVEPGDLIPMPDHQREYYKSHNMYVHNSEMELILATDIPSRRPTMSFGTNPLPWEVTLTHQDTKHLRQAQQKKFVCKNKKCPIHGQETQANYYLITHKKEIPHSDTGDKYADKARNQIDLRRFGKRESIDMHVAVKCKQCKEHIQFVKRTMSNRRAACDPLVAGPHQKFGQGKGARR